MGSAAYANEQMFGQAGSIFTNTNTEVVAPTGKVFIAIQMIADTTFDNLSPQKIVSSSIYPNGMCVGDDTDEEGVGGNGAGSETKYIGSGGQTINAAGDSDLTVFPKGIIIYGRWTAFTIDEDLDGGVIAYVGA